MTFFKVGDVVVCEEASFSLKGEGVGRHPVKGGVYTILDVDDLYVSIADAAGKIDGYEKYMGERFRRLTPLDLLLEIVE